MVVTKNATLSLSLTRDNLRIMNYELRVFPALAWETGKLYEEAFINQPRKYFL